jgi:ABC-type enterochelin transport system ATPase subunit
MQKGRILKTGSLAEVFTNQNLTQLYQLPVDVVDISGRKVALWI